MKKILIGISLVVCLVFATLSGGCFPAESSNYKDLSVDRTITGTLKVLDENRTSYVMHFENDVSISVSKQSLDELINPAYMVGRSWSVELHNRLDHSYVYDVVKVTAK